MRVFLLSTIVLIAFNIGPRSFAAQSDLDIAKCIESFIKLAATPQLNTVPSILNLPDNAALRSDDLKRYGANEIAASLVRRLHEKEIQNRRPDLILYDLINEARIQIGFDAKNIDSIAKNGFQNLHQRASSYDPLQVMENGLRRIAIEDAIIDVRIEPEYKKRRNAKADLIRPKYGQVDFTADVDIGNHRTSYIWGNSVAVLKKEVNLRSTWTLYDSGGTFGTPALSNKKELSEAANQVRSSKGTFLLGAIPKKEGYGQYTEAQVWGTLDLTDVDYFLVDLGVYIDPDGVPTSPKVSAELVQKLISTGKPVYELKVVQTHGRMRAVPGRLLQTIEH